MDSSESPMDITSDEEDNVLGIDSSHSDSDNDEASFLDSLINKTYKHVNGPPRLICRWNIRNFSTITKHLCSSPFEVGPYKWCIKISKTEFDGFLSILLELVDYEFVKDLSVYTRFTLSLVNQIDPQLTIRKDTTHEFNGHEDGSWGFATFIRLEELCEPYVVDDVCIVEADVALHRLINYWSRDFKKETGYVGLKNEGATCYLNPFLQTLYHVPYFRKAVFDMPTSENDIQSQSITLDLQNLFYKLQCVDTSVATKELIKSFEELNWCNSLLHESLSEILFSKLFEEMKGTIVEGQIKHLFNVFPYCTYPYCNKLHTSNGLLLDVKGCRDVYASFEKSHKLEHHFRHHWDEKGIGTDVLFTAFPPVLQLKLKRFEYDLASNTMVKINDRYEFPLQLDLDRENGKYLSPYADRSVRNLYTLHSVLAHGGGVQRGHCYAYIRPTLSDQWFKFDDEQVTKEDIKSVLEKEYGGEEELPCFDSNSSDFSPLKFTRSSNAYMLLYIRESDIENVICNVDDVEHLRLRLKKEQEENEQKRKEEAEVNSCIIIKVARREDLLEQIGKDIYFDLVDHDKVRSFRVKRKMSFSSLKEEVDKEFGIPVECQRFWLWGQRRNGSYRPYRPLSLEEELGPVEKLREFTVKEYGAEMKLYLEVELGKDFRPMPPPKKTWKDILLFFKLYDPLKEELRYVGSLIVKVDDTPLVILEELNKMAGFADGEEIELYEEVRFEPNVMVERIDLERTFRSRQHNDGDIFCFQQKHLPVGSQCSYPDVLSFLECKHKRQVVRFRSREKYKEDAFSLVLSKTDNYDAIVGSVARHIGLNDPSKIRLTSHNCFSQLPHREPIKYGEVNRLSDILVQHGRKSDILYYKVLDIPLPEFQGLKSLKVAFRHATKDEVELGNPSAELRLLQLFHNKITKIFENNEKIENIYDQYWTLRAEEKGDTSEKRPEGY